MNTYSRGNLEKIAYLNGKTINEIIKRRVYMNPESIWAVFRKSDYGPVMTRLAVSAIENEVTKKEVMDLMKNYESNGVIPDNQKVQRVIDSPEGGLVDALVMGVDPGRRRNARRARGQGQRHSVDRKSVV